MNKKGSSTTSGADLAKVSLEIRSVLGCSPAWRRLWERLLRPRHEPTSQEGSENGESNCSGQKPELKSGSEVDKQSLE